MYANRPWTIRQLRGASRPPEESNEFLPPKTTSQPGRWDFSRSAFDLANATAGYDSDHPPRRRRRPARPVSRIDFSRGHEDPLRRHPARQDVGCSMTDERRSAGRWLRGVRRRRPEETRCEPGQAHGDDPERHPQRVHGPQTPTSTRPKPSMRIVGDINPAHPRSFHGPAVQLDSRSSRLLTCKRRARTAVQELGFNAGRTASSYGRRYGRVTWFVGRRIRRGDSRSSFANRP